MEFLSLRAPLNETVQLLASDVVVLKPALLHSPLYFMSTLTRALVRYDFQSAPHLVVMIGAQAVADGVGTEHVGVGHVPVEDAGEAEEVGDGVGYAVSQGQVFVDGEGGGGVHLDDIGELSLPLHMSIGLRLVLLQEARRVATEVPVVRHYGPPL